MKTITQDDAARLIAIENATNNATICNRKSTFLYFTEDGPRYASAWRHGGTGRMMYRTRKI